MAIAQGPANPPAAHSPIHTFSSRLHGEIVRPADADYEVRRQVWNAAFDRRPAMIVRAADPADVIRTVAFARESGLRLAVRAGGHSIPGYSTVDDGLVLDLSGMRRLSIDPATRLAWAEPGLTAGEYTAAAHELGLATPFGDTGTVGIAGLTLGGGIGFLARKHGLTIDSLVSVELVTAEGRLVTASEDENADLFWAVRGGGGNFGVVTGFQYGLHEVGAVFGGGLLLPPTPEVIAGHARAAAAAPDELTTISTVMAAPPAPFIPAKWHGKLAFVTLAVHAGDVASGEAAVAPLRALATPIADTLGPMPYPAIYQYTAAASERHASVARSMFLPALDDAVATTIIDFMRRATSPAAMAQVRILGGAMGGVPAEATAFAHRDKPVMLTIITPFVGPAPVEAHQAWTEAFFEALRPQASGAYVNFLGDEGDARIADAYPAATYRRLAAVKAAYDPENVFRLNQNIRPSAA